MEQLDDAARLSQGMWTFGETYNVIHSSYWGFPLVFSLFVLTVLLFFLHVRVPLATRLNNLGSSKLFWPLRSIAIYWGRRVMRKERDAMLKCRYKAKLMDAIDDDFTAGTISQYEANDMYRYYSKVHPDLENCVEPVAPKDVIKEELKGSKDADGNIIPIPIPDGGGTKSTSTIAHVHAI